MNNESGDDEVEELREFDWEEWEKNDQDSVDGMRQGVYSKGKEMHNEMSGQWFLKRKIMMVERGKKKNEFQYEVSQQRSNFGGSQVEQ